MKHGKMMSWLLTAGVSLALFGVISQGLLESSESLKQTVTSSSTRVVVVVIPGFPLESILVGSLVGFAILGIVRRLKQRPDNSRLLA